MKFVLFSSFFDEKKQKKRKNSNFDLRTACQAPVRWSKYTPGHIWEECQHLAVLFLTKGEEEAWQIQGWAVG